MMDADGCGSAEHRIARRQFLGSLALGAGAAASGLGGLGWFTRPAMARHFARDQKRMIVFNLQGGLSQLESWDPKPGTDGGGPFRAIRTSVPGIHISELLPHTARQMHHLALLRSLNTKDNSHNTGPVLMATGRQPTPAASYPHIGAVVAKAFDSEDRSLPGHVRIQSGGGGRNLDAAYLGPRYASIGVTGKPPGDANPPPDLTDESARLRDDFRCRLNRRFLAGRDTAETDAYVQSYEMAKELVRQREIFDVTKESEKDQKRYGQHAFGRHCLLARRLLEAGVTFAQITHGEYDTHVLNFSVLLQMLGEFDGPFATFVSDLADRGMLDSTLVVVLSEFGRTPTLNAVGGREHQAGAWSICLGGASIVRGAVVGKTNERGSRVVEREADAGQLFHTYLRALGLRSSGHFTVGGRKMPMADPALEPIQELLA